MPVIVSQRQGRLTETNLTLADGEVIHAAYYPDRISGKMLKTIILMGQLLDAEPTDEIALAVAQACEDAAGFIVKVVARWDLQMTEDPMDIAPLEQDVVADFGLGLLFDILTALVSAVKMGEANGTRSSTRSRRTSSSRSRNSSRR